jgi:plastocyanin
MNGTTHGGGTVGGANDLPSCGLVQLGQAPCTFKGGDDVESEGGVAGFGPNGPAAVDWQITVTAGPGEYDYFCYVHPGMRGHFTVVRSDRDSDRDDRVTTQDQINDASQAQFREDREDALEAERAANVVHFSGGAPGTRTYDVSVGISAAENHGAIDEMLPQHLNLDQGDRVVYHWRDPHNIHTVTFPADNPNVTLPPPFIPEAEPNEQFELVGDPGNAPRGTVLSNPSALVDAGLFGGTGYQLQPTVQEWSVRTDNSTSAGAYLYQCTVHDFMLGTLRLTK